MMCRLMGVTPSEYYSYQKRKRTRPANKPEHQGLLDWVKKISESSKFSYGNRRIRKVLNALGYPVGRRKTRSLMREAGVFVRYKKKYKVTTNSNHNQPVFDNVLNRQFNVNEPNRAYVSDITYIPTHEGWLYLTVMIDLFSRKVVGWNMSSRMKADTVCDALTMAIWQRKPKAGLIVHSDRGSQYASKQYRDLLNQHGLVGSMSKKGDCWDNSVAESFFSRLKNQLIHWRNYQTRREAKQDILDYMTMFYNNQRLHSFLGYQSPNQFENRFWGLMKNVA
ncbi:transposase [Legionella spiritensis]|nr:transposase [Legionella spiritensis]